MQYRVNWSYRAGKLGPWSAGDLVDLSDSDAAHVAVDSPGCLSLVSAPLVPKGEEVPPEADADEVRPVDRQARRPGRKRAEV